MKPAVKAATVIGWGAGLILILAGAPVAAAAAVFAAVTACAAACARWSLPRRAWLKVRVIHLPARSTGTRSALERT